MKTRKRKLRKGLVPLKKVTYPIQQFSLEMARKFRNEVMARLVRTHKPVLYFKGDPYN